MEKKSAYEGKKERKVRPDPIRDLISIEVT